MSKCTICGEQLDFEQDICSDCQDDLEQYQG